MDEQLIYERMKQLSNESDRELYRDMSKVFAEIVNYNQEKVEELAARIKDEIKDVYDRYYIYQTVVDSKDILLANEFMYSMENQKKPERCIATVFCECSRKQMDELLQLPQMLRIETAHGVLDKMVKLLPCRRYYKKVEELRKAFHANGRILRNFNLPYLSKFADIIVEEGFEGLDHIQGISFLEHTFPCHINLVPMWNVEETVNRCTIFPIPRIDEQNYEHVLSFVKKDDGYLIRNQAKIKEIVHHSRGLSVISEEKTAIDFDMYHIAKAIPLTIPHSPVCSNACTMRHIDRHAVNPLQTRAELYRMLSGYECSRYIHFKDLSFDQKGDIEPLREVFYPFQREDMTFLFSLDYQDFISEDEISFLLAEVADLFHPYRIRGKIINVAEKRADL